MNVKFWQALLACLFALLAGCATPLTTEEHGGNLADVVGVPRENVLFLSYCEFGECRSWEKDIRFISGVIVVTREKIHLLGGDLRSVSSKREIALMYRELEGVDLRRYGRGRQIQVRRGEHLVVIQITKNKALVDQGGSEQVFRMIKEHGVPSYVSERFYLMRSSPMIFVPIFIP